MSADLKIADYIKVIPPELKRPVELKSWAALVRCLIVIAAFQLLLYHLPALGTQNLPWNLPLHAILICISGLSFVGLFVLCHDCGHSSFSRHKTVNDVVGFLCFIPLLNSFFAWRAAHNFHHQHTQIRRVDPDWPELLSTAEEYPLLPWYERLAIRLGPGNVLGLLIGFWAGMVKRTFFTLLIRQMKLPLRSAVNLYLLNALSLVLTLILVVSYAEFLGTQKFLVMYVVPVLIAASTGAFLTFIQHSHPGSYVFDRNGFDSVLAHVHSTFNIRFPGWLEFFWLDINIHTPHHVLPGIPWYHLRRANEVLRLKFPDSVNERKFSLQGLRKSWDSTTLVKVKEGLYQLQ